MAITKNTCYGVAITVMLVFGNVVAEAGLKIQHWQTSQGAEVYFVENHDLPIIDVSVDFAAGSSRDTKAKVGLADMTRGLMGLGAAGMTDEQIAGAFADIGANLGGDVDPDRSSVTLRTLSSERESKRALALFSNVLQKPDFPEAVLEREKSRLIAGLREAATQPDSIANKAFAAALFGDHPYAFPEAGEPEAVSAFKRDDLVNFYHTHYQAKGAIIAMMGDLSRERANAIAESLASGLPQEGAEVSVLADVSMPTAPKMVSIPHPATQSHILLGYPGVKRGDPDYFPLYVGNYILGGGGFVSRLTNEVREKRGLVYSVYSYFVPLASVGPFQIGLQTKRSQGSEALKLVRETLDQFIKGGVTEKELKAAKQNIIGGFPMRIDSNGKIIDYLAVIGFYHLPLTYLDDFNKEVERVTTAQIKEAFARRIHPENMVTITVAGDPVK